MANVKHRHRARRLAMQAICCLDVQGEDHMDLALGFVRESREPLDAIYLAERMLEGAWAQRQRSDESLRQISRHWDIHRMPLVDRNILRLAVWELQATQTPYKVVINEAVRLAQEFSTAESPRFINGILDAVASRTGAAEREAPEAPDRGEGEPA